MAIVTSGDLRLTGSTRMESDLAHATSTDYQTWDLTVDLPGLGAVQRSPRPVTICRCLIDLEL